MLKNLKFLAMPKDESYFIMINYATLYIYELDDTSPKFDVKLVESIDMKQKIIKGEMTSDDKYLVILSDMVLKFYSPVDKSIQ